MIVEKNVRMAPRQERRFIARGVFGKNRISGLSGQFTPFASAPLEFDQ
jgi:hypothetical protein